ncbi:polysaccharide deacetylase family protein [Symbiobacterium terraclitae]|uniref:polysaccharide deacetylase family protein n=1 Tax=Symbiobacterium terraclitae TaxID=557451 RepID=UPI0035B51D47
MKKQWIASVLCAAMLLSGCAAASSDPPSGRTPPVSDPTDPTPGIADPGDPNGPAGPGDPSGADEPGSPSDPSGPDGEPDGSENPGAPAVTWKPGGIGYPLVPSDPAVEQKVAMLTFDDGPSNYTPQVLEGLREAGVKAVFFITGYGAAQHPDLVKRIHEEGHLLGIHTMTHPNMTSLGREEQIAEIQPLIDLITDVTGEPPRYFRPPFGAYNDELLATLDELGLELINWSNGSLDWDDVVDGYKDPNLVVEAVLDQLHPGSVILAHDTMKHTAEAVPLIIAALRERGYEFVVLP